MNFFKGKFHIPCQFCGVECQRHTNLIRATCFNCRVDRVRTYASLHRKPYTSRVSLKKKTVHRTYLTDKKIKWLGGKEVGDTVVFPKQYLPK